MNSHHHQSTGLGSKLTVLWISACFFSQGIAGTFQDQIEPILIEYCYDCHGDGSYEGQVALDEISPAPEDAALWHRVLKNLRANLMPPHVKPRPTAEEFAELEMWIKYSALGIDPKKLDPGPSNPRRLNRFEFRNSIRELMGIEFDTAVEFPPDDSGYGFDHIGSVLSISPMLAEKYFSAARAIVAEAVPLSLRVPAEQVSPGSEFWTADQTANGRRLPFSKSQQVKREFQLKRPGTYEIHFHTEVDGAFNFDPGECRVDFFWNDQTLKTTEHAWRPSDKFHDVFRVEAPEGAHSITIKLESTVPTENQDEQIYFEIHQVRLRGPMEESEWIRPERYDLFYSRDDIPVESAERLNYAKEVIEQFVTRAFRRPPLESTVNRLLQVAVDTFQQPDKSFQDGIAQAMVAALTSPRFLLRIDYPAPSHKETEFPLIDEFSLASRLSYFLWSSMPDAELFSLAARGKLREQLLPQVDRMLADPKAGAFVKNFVGQWLQSRNVESVPINARAVIGRETKEDPKVTQMRTRYFTLVRKPAEERSPAEDRELEELRKEVRKIFRRPRVELNSQLRQAMRRETEESFRYILEADRSILELLDSNYTFLNESLAKHYQIEGVEGSEMRRVVLPENHVRGGILTQGTTLVVTSNPTRTSPVKRGLFILENILATPPPPPPADVPDLEEAEANGEEPTLREALAMHRESPLCRSCHNRMDPLGFSLEHFNAMGMWREQELEQPIDATGKLITGEAFENIAELKLILTTDRREDFYRCLTEKLLTYALARGLEPNDIEVIDRLVDELDRKPDTLRTLIQGIVLSIPFQRMHAPDHHASRELAMKSPTERVNRQ